MSIDTLCFSSGGIQGISFIGALKYLLDKKYIDIFFIKNFIGTSVGSIISFLLVINYSIDELLLFLITFDFKKLELDYDINCIFNNYGIDNGEKMLNLLILLLENKLKIKDITFIELYNITKKNLIIIGTNFTKGNEEIFSYEKTPNMSVIIALRISISIPIIFTPVLFNNNYYIDGCITNNFGLNLCNKNTTLGFLIKNNELYKLESLQDLIIGTLCMLTLSSNNYSNYEIININIFDDNVINFNINNIYIKKLINNGKKFAKKHVKCMYINKINKIVNKNKKIKKIISDLLYEIIDKI